MDTQLVDSVIEIVTRDIDRTNEYNHLDKLLLTFSDEEIIYFLNRCDEDLFLNETLSWMLIKTIPQHLKIYVEKFVQDRLDMTDNLEYGINQKLMDGEIDKEFYDESIREYQHVRSSAHEFKILYMREIDRELKKRIKI